MTVLKSMHYQGSPIFHSDPTAINQGGANKKCKIEISAGRVTSFEGNDLMIIGQLHEALQSREAA